MRERGDSPGPIKTLEVSVVAQAAGSRLDHLLRGLHLANGRLTNPRVQRGSTKAQHGRIRSFAYGLAAALTLLLAAGGVAAGQDYAQRKDANWLLGSKVTLFKLDDAVGATPGPTEETFHGVRIICETELAEEAGVELIRFLFEIAAEQEEMLKKPGIPGGVPGCIGWGTGLRFQRSDRTFDAFACLQCWWMWGTDRSRPVPSMTYVFGTQQLSRLRRIVNASMGCGAIARRGC